MVFHWVRTLLRAAAAAGLLAASVPLAFWAVPAIHPRLVARGGWLDTGTSIELRVVRRGFDRHGYVHQEQTRSWDAADPARLADVRRAYAADPQRFARLPPLQSWRFEMSDYGNNHVYLPGGLEQTDGGVTHVIPYGLMAAALATPAACLGLASRRGRGAAGPPDVPPA